MKPSCQHWTLALAVGACLFAGHSRSEEPAPFRTGILPILTKAGCNAGACHGAATGQGGFKLSLLGYDPEEDHARITRELGGRRLDLAQPAHSLFLRKPSEDIDHEGGLKLRDDSAGYATLREWIAAGAPYGPRDLQVTSVAVLPNDSLLPDVGQSLPLRVRATLSDGTEQDVTALALYSSNDAAVAEVSKAGQLTTRGRGLTSIMVRYGGQVAAARVAVPFTGVPGEFASQNFIDDYIGAELRRLRLPSAALSSDAEFLRRVCLDLIGRLPTSDEARAFAHSPATPERRRNTIDHLLQSPEFIDLWTMRLADLLLLGRNATADATRVYHQWLRNHVAAGTPLDRVIRELLTSFGDTATRGEANFFVLETDPRDLAEHVSRMFLGTQIACARCHAHPSDRWTQDDYHHFAAYFARLQRDGNKLRVSNQGDVLHPKTGKVMEPKPLGAPATAGPRERSASDRREALAAWLAAPDNALFTHSLTNRVWKHLLGRGLVEPVDDLRPTNPPTHPALLRSLAADFASHQFDLRHLVRTIAGSRTYQLSSTAAPGAPREDRFYSHAYVRPLPAPVFLDAVSQATGVRTEFPAHPAGTRAVELVEVRIPFPALDILGRCSRQAPCDSPGQGGGGLARALHLLNGCTIQAKLRGGILDELLEKNMPDSAAIDELYLRTLTRLPSPGEKTEWTALFTKTRDRREPLEDLLWTLLNSREFGFNH